MLKDQVKITLICGLDNFMKFDDIFMLHLMEERYLSICPLSISGVLESIKYFFKGKGLFCFFIKDFPDVPICSASQKFFGLVEFEHMRLNLFGHELGRIENDFK